MPQGQTAFELPRLIAKAPLNFLETSFELPLLFWQSSFEEPRGFSAALL